MPSEAGHADRARRQCQRLRREFQRASGHQELDDARLAIDSSDGHVTLTLTDRAGRLVFTSRRGRPLFEDTDICDTDLTDAFSERDARAFVREFRRLKAERH